MAREGHITEEADGDTQAIVLDLSPVFPLMGRGRGGTGDAACQLALVSFPHLLDESARRESSRRSGAFRGDLGYP